MVYDCTQGFPTNRARLYKKALDILLEEWAAEKRVYQDEVYQGLNPDLEKVLLSEIASSRFVNDQLFFTEEEIVEQIKEFLADTVDKPKYLDGKAVLDAIAIQQGILVERAEDIFSFSHLTLQEYLTAQYISQDSDYIKKYLEKYLTVPRWREVFLLIAGSISNADKLLESMEFKSRNCIISSSKIKNLITWAENYTNILNSCFEPVVRRSIAIAIALAFAKIGKDYVVEYERGTEAFINTTNLASILYRPCLRVHSQIHALAQLLSIYNKDVIAFFDATRKIFSSQPISQAYDYDYSISENNIDDSDFGASGIYITKTNLSNEAIENISINLNSTSDSMRAMSNELVYIINAMDIFREDVKSEISKALTSLRYEMSRVSMRSKNFGNQAISYGVTRGFVEDIRKKVLNSLKLTPEQTNFSEEEIKALANYLYINELIVNSRTEAVRVSREKWENLKQRMLTVIE